MTHKHRISKAFTLIELLVVIAIIALLAAILFPVFAQAKLAAQKTAALNNVKQQGLAVLQYAGDWDDAMPCAFGLEVSDDGNPNTSYGWDSYSYMDVPVDWRAKPTEIQKRSYRMAVANSTQIYRNSYELLALPGHSQSFGPYPSDEYAKAAKAPAVVGLAYNGLLQGYNYSAITNNAELPMYTQTTGDVAFKGVDGGPIPVLSCSRMDPCVYVPHKHGCADTDGAGRHNGERSWVPYPSPDYATKGSQWIYGHSQTWVFADGHAKSRQLGMNFGGRTDFHRDPFSQYTERGLDGGVGWWDENYCHLLIFEPDFDFSTWPANPVEGPG